MSLGQEERKPKRKHSEDGSFSKTRRGNGFLNVRLAENAYQSHAIVLVGRSACDIVPRYPWQAVLVQDSTGRTASMGKELGGSDWSHYTRQARWLQWYHSHTCFTNAFVLVALLRRAALRLFATALCNWSHRALPLRLFATALCYWSHRARPLRLFASGSLQYQSQVGLPVQLVTLTADSHKSPV
jgi:hypothetical protein